jgi:RimJ/RimL family protein N-acetyltransferase
LIAIDLLLVLSSIAFKNVIILPPPPRIISFFSFYTRATYTKIIIITTLSTIYLYIDTQYIPLFFVLSATTTTTVITCCGHPLMRNLHLRSLRLDDASALAPLYTCPTAMKYYRCGRVLEPAQVGPWLASFLTESTPGNAKNHIFAIILDGVTVGFVQSIEASPDELAGSSPVEIAYCVVPSMSGKGIATAASAILMDSICGDFFASYHPDNSGSRRVLQKLGFVDDPDRQKVERNFEGVVVVRNYSIYES